MCRENLLTEVSNEELEAFLARLKPQVLDNEYKIAESLVHTLLELSDAHTHSKAKVRALLKQIFGEFTSEKMFSEAPVPATDSKTAKPPSKKPREGGLRSADSFTGAKREEIVFGPKRPELCPKCQQKIHKTEPRHLIRFAAAPPVSATVYEVERLRCRHCEAIVEADIPNEVGTEKYDSSVYPWLGYSRYRLGIPMYRLAQCQEQAGVPLPVQTQYMLLATGVELLRSVFDLMELLASQSFVFISDDTPNKILKLKLRQDESGKVRKGVYTSAIQATLEDQTEIALYYTANRHQGENMGALLRRRDARANKIPLHMTDGSSHARPKGMGERSEDDEAGHLQVKVARCLVHARRRIFKIREDYREPCDYLLKLFSQIFKVEEELVRNKASPKERLEKHTRESAPAMEAILKYCQDSLQQKIVEPNSTLGSAMRYITEDYDALSLFLHDPDSPLHTNSVERMIKDVARHRKNSLFFRTLNGAQTGDIWLSVIKTCEVNGVRPWEYLKDLFQKNTPETISPQHWLPWVWAQRQRKN